MSNVLSLGTIARPCSANVIRSSLYLKKRDSIDCVARQACLTRLELNLFRAGLDIARAVENSPLPRDLQAFPDIEGVVHYYYSDTQRKYVFLDFDLAGGGGGKTVEDVDNPRRGPRVIWINQDPPVVEDIAARHAATVYSAQSRRREAVASIVVRMGVDDPDGGGRDGARAPRFYGAVAPWASASRLLTSFWRSRARRLSELLAALLSYLARSAGLRHDSLEIYADLVRVHSLLHGAGSFQHQILPSWSLLRRSYYVAEQLENDFARRILIGEFACRLRSDAPRAFRYTWLFTALPGARRNVIASVRGEKLYEETRSVLGNLLWPKEFELPKRANFYRFVRYADKDCLSDDRIAWLARGEMAYHLAGVLLDESTAVNGARQRAGTFGVRSADYALMRKFALFSDFISLSDLYFGLVGAPSPARWNACTDRRNRSDDWRAGFSTLETRLVGEYGDVASLIARQVYGNEPEPDGTDMHGETMRSLHDRLLQIVSELLESKGAAALRRASKTAD